MSTLAMYSMIIAAAILGGAAAGLTGCFTVAMNMPFLAVCMAHAGMAGAVFANMAGVPTSVGTFSGALAGTVLLLLLLRRSDHAQGGAVGVIFSLMLGIAFLGIGLSKGPKTTALALMWGNLLFVTPGHLAAIAVVLILMVSFTVWRTNDLKLILFSRSLAATLTEEHLWFSVLVLLSAAVITVNLQTVGGLLLYSLVCNPAMAAAKLARGFPSYLCLGSLLGAGSALTGFLGAWALDLPVGACIVIVSSVMLVGAAGAEACLAKRS